MKKRLPMLYIVGIIFLVLAFFAVLFLLFGKPFGKKADRSVQEVTATDAIREDSEEKTADMKANNSDKDLKIRVNGKDFSAKWEDNQAVHELKQRLSQDDLTLQLSDYSGFEKVGALGFSLKQENRQITTQTGDIVLYNGNQIVLFYGSNSWSYTKLAGINDLTGWEDALGKGDVNVILSLK